MPNINLFLTKKEFTNLFCAATHQPKKQMIFGFPFEFGLNLMKLKGLFPSIIDG